MTFIIERIYIASIDQSNAINAAADKHVTQRDMADFYADCLICDAISRRDGLTRIDWQQVNDAIINRWSFSGLNRVKERAWKLVETAKMKGGDQ